MVLSLLAFTAAHVVAYGQARPTSVRVLDIQVGGEYSNADSDYEPLRVQGFGFYSDVDFRPHFGAEVDFHQLNESTTKLYERTYEAGGRYYRTYGSLKPYVKGLYGRGVLNFPQNSGNIAYNMFVGGGGMDFALKPYLNVRLDYEYQRWNSGPGIDHGITPQVLSIGAAYHFGRGKPHILMQ
jgi:opacity protein-like surface antigen